MKKISFHQQIRDETPVSALTRRDDKQAGLPAADLLTETQA